MISLWIPYYWNAGSVKDWGTELEVVESKEAASLVRIYAYVDDEGNSFWSFKKYPQTVSPSRRFTLQSRLGTTLPAFMQFVREQGQEMLAEAAAEDRTVTDK